MSSAMASVPLSPPSFHSTVWKSGAMETTWSTLRSDISTTEARRVLTSWLRDRMLELNQQITWTPTHVKDGSFGKWLANALDKVLGLKKTLRGSNLPIIAGFPFPIAVEILPAHLPLPAKIRTELLEPIEVDDDPERVDDEAYVQKIYDQVEAQIQAGMDRLAAKRTLPVLG